MSRPEHPLKRERVLRGWSQSHLAERIEAPAASYISRWERGVTSPSPYYRERLCRLFEKNAQELGLLEAPAEEDPTLDEGHHPVRARWRFPALQFRWRWIVSMLVLTAVMGGAGAWIESAIPHQTRILTRAWPSFSYDIQSQSEQVRAIQLLLQFDGYDLGTSGPDGTFGTATESAVKDFQQNSGLGVTGRVDGATWDKLVTPSYLGKRGHQVEAVQRLLVAHDTKLALHPDGFFGRDTEDAVKRFQRARGLSASGIADRDTWCLLVDGRLR